MNRYNTEQRLVTPAATSQPYAITPAQAQQLDRMTQPIHIPDAPATQVSETRIDVSQIFEPIQIKEQFSPVERAQGFALRSGLFIVGALLVSLASAWLVELNTIRMVRFLCSAVPGDAGGAELAGNHLQQRRARPTARKERSQRTTNDCGQQ